MARSKIAFVLPSFAGGGAERVMLRLLASLSPVRYQVVLIVLSSDGPLRSSLPPGVDLVDLNCTRLRSAFMRLRHAISRAKPDIVVSTMGYLNLAVLAVCATLFRSPMVIVREANTVQSSLNRLPYWSGKWAYRLLYPRARAVICNAQHVARELETLCVLPRPVQVIFNPVDQGAIRRYAVLPLPVDVGGEWYVAIGRLSPQKGFDRLLEALASCPATVKVLILGDGPERAMLQQLAETLGVASQVTFMGYQDNPWAFLARSRGLIMTSRWEGFPNVALEALACGIPVFGFETVDGLDELRTLASVDAVSLSQYPIELCKALSDSARSLVPKDDLNPSLLPAAFQASVVEKQFAAILDQALTERCDHA